MLQKVSIYLLLIVMKLTRGGILFTKTNHYKKCNSVNELISYCNFIKRLTVFNNSVISKIVKFNLTLMNIIIILIIPVYFYGIIYVWLWYRPKSTTFHKPSTKVLHLYLLFNIYVSWSRPCICISLYLCRYFLLAFSFFFWYFNCE